MYFRRALKLNPQYLSAWTLMGHEYVEMKNPPAAIGGLGVGGWVVFGGGGGVVEWCEGGQQGRV